MEFENCEITVGRPGHTGRFEGILARNIMQESVNRIQGAHGPDETFSSSGLLARYSHEFRQTQRFLSLFIHKATSDGLFNSLKKQDKIKKADSLSCREHEASDWLRAVPDPKFRTAISGALWSTMISLRLLIPWIHSAHTVQTQVRQQLLKNTGITL